MLYRDLYFLGGKEDVIDDNDDVGLLNLFGDETTEQVYEDNTSPCQLSDEAIAKDNYDKEMSSNKKGNVHIAKRL